MYLDQPNKTTTQYNWYVALGWVPYPDSIYAQITAGEKARAVKERKVQCKLTPEQKEVIKRESIKYIKMGVEGPRIYQLLQLEGLLLDDYDNTLGFPTFTRMLTRYRWGLGKNRKTKVVSEF